MAIAGYNTIGGTTDLDGANDGAVNGPYTVGSGSTITEIWCYLTASGADALIRPLIYGDSGGEPGALLSTVAEVSVLDGATPAWVGHTGLSVVTSTADIWIGMWFNNNAHRYYYDTPGGTPMRYKSVLATYSSSGAAPDPWPTASDSAETQKQSVYVVYTAGGGTNATVTAAVATSTASSVAPPKPRPANPFAEINVRM